MGRFWTFAKKDCESLDPSTLRGERELPCKICVRDAVSSLRAELPMDDPKLSRRPALKFAVGFGAALAWPGSKVLGSITRAKPRFSRRWKALGQAVGRPVPGLRHVRAGSQTPDGGDATELAQFVLRA
jgi:hypothetical protein